MNGKKSQVNTVVTTANAELMAAGIVAVERQGIVLVGGGKEIRKDVITVKVSNGRQFLANPARLSVECATGFKYNIYQQYYPENVDQETEYGMAVALWVNEDIAETVAIAIAKQYADDNGLRKAIKMSEPDFSEIGDPPIERSEGLQKLQQSKHLANTAPTRKIEPILQTTEVSSEFATWLKANGYRIYAKLWRKDGKVLQNGELIALNAKRKLQVQKAMKDHEETQRLAGELAELAPKPEPIPTFHDYMVNQGFIWREVHGMEGGGYFFNPNDNENMEHLSSEAEDVLYREFEESLKQK